MSYAPGALRSRGGIVYTTAPRSGSRGLKDTLLSGLDGAINLFLAREQIKVSGRQPTRQTESTIPAQTVADRDPDDPPSGFNFSHPYVPLLLLGIGVYMVTR